MTEYTLRFVTNTSHHIMIKTLKTPFDHRRVLDTMYDAVLLGYWIDNLFIPNHKIEYIEVTK
jgi:hypothetical protein